MKVVEYFGYSDCIQLENKNCKVILAPSIGGKILEYSLYGKNVLLLIPEECGWTYKEGTDLIFSSAGRFDIGPEMTIPNHPVLWLGKWEYEIIGDEKVRLTSQIDSATGVQLIREFSLNVETSQLICEQKIKNISEKPIHWSHWGRTLVPGNGICIVPLTPPSLFPNSYVMYGPNKSLFWAPEDNNIKQTDNFLIITGAPKYPKLCMDSYAGWFCYLMPNNLMFVKKFPTFPNRRYNEITTTTVSIWYCNNVYGNAVCELEPIGPREDISAGNSSSFREEWWLLHYNFPSITDNIDLQALENYIEKNTKKIK